MTSTVTSKDVETATDPETSVEVYDLDTTSTAAPVDEVALGTNLSEWQVKALAALREPFPAAEIGKLPKSGCTDCKRFTACGNRGHVMVRNCPECKQDHPSSTFHIDYVGHAALTNRLLSIDPTWNWEPLALDPQGLPLARNGEMWIRLTIAGVTRLGVGEGKTSKILIGNALRNAGMRFGLALALWWKGEFDDFEEDEVGGQVLGAQAAAQPPAAPAFDPDVVATFVLALNEAVTAQEAKAVWAEAKTAGVLEAPIEFDGRQGLLHQAITYQGKRLAAAEEAAAATMELPQGEVAADMVQGGLDAAAQGEGQMPSNDEPPF